jgi:hypothetical protein
MEEDMGVCHPPPEASPMTRKAIKFEVQVYRVRSGGYIIDMQRLDGHLYLFLDLCADLIAQLAEPAEQSMPMAIPGH